MYLDGSGQGVVVVRARAVHGVLGWVALLVHGASDLWSTFLVGGGESRTGVSDLGMGLILLWCLSNSGFQRPRGF